MKKIHCLIWILFTVPILFSCEQQVDYNSDPLPSWNESKSKQTIMEFVHDVTNEANPNFVKPADRIVTFDNDGTLWSEQPYYFQLQFALDRVKALEPEHPEWRIKPLFEAFLGDDIKTALSFGMHGVLDLVMATHSGMTTEEFEKIVKEWINTAKHPKTTKLYKEMVFQPVHAGITKYKQRNVRL